MLTLLEMRAVGILDSPWYTCVCVRCIYTHTYIHIRVHPHLQLDFLCSSCGAGLHQNEFEVLLHPVLLLLDPKHGYGIQGFLFVFFFFFLSLCAYTSVCSVFQYHCPVHTKHGTLPLRETPVPPPQNEL